MAKSFATAAAILFALAGTTAFAHGTGESSAAGKPGDPDKITRTIDVTMQDTMRFTPSAILVKRGDTVRFVVHNSGQVAHEMMLGSMDELKEHAEMMRSMPNMSHHDANAVTVEPGKAGTIVWRFDKAGAVDFACLVPGHFEAGMKGTITVR